MPWIFTGDEENWQLIVLIPAQKKILFCEFYEQHGTLCMEQIRLLYFNFELSVFTTLTLLKFFVCSISHVKYVQKWINLNQLTFNCLCCECRTLALFFRVGNTGGL